MNRLYFEGKAVNLYSVDYDYLQDSLYREAKKLSRAITGETLEPVISTGFIPAISTTDTTKLRVYHNGTYGTILTGNGVLVDTEDTYDEISLSDYTLGTVNLIFAKYESKLATYRIAYDDFVYERKAVDFGTQTLVYNRQLDVITIVCLTQAEYDALTTEQKRDYIYLGETTANGPGVPLTSVDTSKRKYLSAAIPDNSITLLKLVNTFMLPQTMVETSVTINDSYSGIPQNLQDDLNKIRTQLKNVKSTPHWDDPAVGLKGSDNEMNYLHRTGIFDYYGDGLEVQLTSGGTFVTVKTGKILYQGVLREFNADTSLAIPAPTTVQVGDFTSETGYELHAVDASIPTSFALDHILVSDVIITSNPPEKPYTVFRNPEDYTYDPTTGIVTTTTSGEMYNENVRCYYTYFVPRCDTLIIGTSAGIQIIEGTPDYVPKPPVIPSGCIPLKYLYYLDTNNYLTEDSLVSSSIWVEPIREAREISYENLAYYADGGSGLTTADWIPHKLAFIDSSTGLHRVYGDGWSIETLHDLSYVYIDDTDILVRTVVYTQKDSNLILQALPTDENVEVHLEYEITPNTGVLDGSTTISIPKNTSSDNILPVPYIFDITLSEGYHQLEFSVTTGSSVYLHNLIVQKLDKLTKYNLQRTYQSDLLPSGTTQGIQYIDFFDMDYGTGITYTSTGLTDSPVFPPTGTPSGVIAFHAYSDTKPLYFKLTYKMSIADASKFVKLHTVFYVDNVEVVTQDETISVASDILQHTVQLSTIQLSNTYFNSGSSIAVRIVRDNTIASNHNGNFILVDIGVL